MGRLLGQRERQRQTVCWPACARRSAGASRPDRRHGPLPEFMPTRTLCRPAKVAGLPTAWRVSRLARCETDVVYGGEFFIRGCWYREAGAVVVTPCVPRAVTLSSGRRDAAVGSLLPRRQRSFRGRVADLRIVGPEQLSPDADHSAGRRPGPPGPESPISRGLVRAGDHFPELRAPSPVCGLGVPGCERGSRRPTLCAHSDV